jgi:glycosyltransferase involved in cell wall biosynthesis
MSRVDVIIPCYNYARFLPQCVQSVLNQPGVDVRALVIDDASSDDTADVAARLAAADGRVHFVRHAQNRGHIATYNEGLAWANGDYLLLLSADDVLTPGALGRAATVLGRHPELSFVYGRAIATPDPNPTRVPDPGEYRYRVVETDRFVRRTCETGANLAPTPTAVVRTTVQHAAGGYKPELPHTGDLEMWVRLAAHGPVGVIDADQAFYRVHGQNMHKSTYQAARTVFEQHWAAFDIFFRDLGDRFADRDRLQATARRLTALNGLKKAAGLFDRGDPVSATALAQLVGDHFPALREEPAWRRFRLKRAVGHRTLRCYRAARRLFRRPAPKDLSPFISADFFADRGTDLRIGALSAAA